MIKKADDYSIHVIKDMNDPELIHHWKRIQKETDSFPQMYYEWCEPWWRLQSGKRELHIVTVEDAMGKIVGIAPMCIEKRVGGLRILRSFPIHFGDFYSFLSEDDHQEFKISEAIIGYLKLFRFWDVVHLVNVNDKSSSWPLLKANGFRSKVLTNVLVADFHDVSFENYLKTLSRNTRQQFGKKLRRLDKVGDVSLECIEDASGYMRYVNEMKYLYNARWADDHSLPPDSTYHQCRNEAVQALIKQNKMSLFLLKLDDKVKIFRLGFMHNQTFYDWKVSHDPSIDEFSPGLLIMGKIIDQLILRKYTQFNFMTGDYRYKRSWATEGAESVNYELFASGSSLLARIYLQYQLVWRDKLRTRYYALLEIAWVRAVKRWVETQRRRLKQ